MIKMWFQNEDKLNPAKVACETNEEFITMSLDVLRDPKIIAGESSGFIKKLVEYAGLISIHRMWFFSRTLMS